MSLHTKGPKQCHCTPRVPSNVIAHQGSQALIQRQAGLVLLEGCTSITKASDVQALASALTFALRTPVCTRALAGMVWLHHSCSSATLTCAVAHAASRCRACIKLPRHHRVRRLRSAHSQAICSSLAPQQNQDFCKNGVVAPPLFAAPVVAPLASGDAACRPRLPFVSNQPTFTHTDRAFSSRCPLAASAPPAAPPKHTHTHFPP